MKEKMLYPKTMDQVRKDIFRVYRALFPLVLPWMLGSVPVVLGCAYAVQGVHTPWVHWPLALFFLLVVTYGYGVLLACVMALLNRQPVRFLMASRWVMRRLWTLFGVVCTTTALISLGAVLAFFPGVFLLVLLGFAAPAVLFEGQGMWGAITMSAQLVYGQWWRTFWVFMTPAVVWLFVISVLSLALHSDAVQGLAYVFILPWVATSVIVQMGDLQVRLAIKRRDDGPTQAGIPVVKDNGLSGRDGPLRL